MADGPDRDADVGDAPGGESDVGERVAGDRAEVAELSAQLLRATTDRVTTWRTRLDQTTNWAVVVLAAILTWAFSSPDNPHYVLLIGVLAVSAFLGVEAHRFRQYDAWRGRLRILEENLFAEVYDPGGREDADWRADLAAEFRSPELKLSTVDALGHRLRRVYLWLLGVLLLAWVVRATTFAPDARGVEAAAIGPIRGEVVAAGVGAYALALVALAAWSLRGATKREFDESDDELERG
jgi:uncharacterized membrane protein